MWVSYSGKKKKPSYHGAPHSQGQTHVSTIKETDTTSTEVSGYATILICFINTGLNTKTHSYTHKIRSSCAGRATKASLPWGGGGDWVSESLCVFNGKQLDQVFLLLSLLQYIAANPQIVVTTGHLGHLTHHRATGRYLTLPY